MVGEWNNIRTDGGFPGPKGSSKISVINELASVDANSVGLDMSGEMTGVFSQGTNIVNSGATGTGIAFRTPGATGWNHCTFGTQTC